MPAQTLQGMSCNMTTSLYFDNLPAFNKANTYRQAIMPLNHSMIGSLSIAGKQAITAAQTASHCYTKQRASRLLFSAGTAGRSCIIEIGSPPLSHHDYHYTSSCQL
jgi:hypothetical protein